MGEAEALLRLHCECLFDLHPIMVCHSAASAIDRTAHWGWCRNALWQRFARLLVCCLRVSGSNLFGVAAPQVMGLVSVLYRNRVAGVVFVEGHM